MMVDDITEDELSLTDKDMADKIRDILSSRYGLISLSEPVLHTAVANAAALNFIVSDLKNIMPGKPVSSLLNINNFDMNWQIRCCFSKTT